MTAFPSPSIAVLMATFNGIDFIESQVDSVLRQQGVRVRLLVADDGSDDGTREWLEELALRDERVTLIDDGVGGNAPRNFLRLALHAPLEDADAVAFVDQDDIWFDDKLSKQWVMLDEVDAVSSDVFAFYPDQPAVMIRKTQPQRRFDYVCESGGPGCTFLLRRDAFDRVTDAVRAHELLPEIPAHDWLFYAVARALGLRWRIDPEPTMSYRQHGQNVLGANVGLRHGLARGRKLLNGSFRQQCATIARICADVSGDPELEQIAQSLAHKCRSNNLHLARIAPQLRRRPRDRAILQTLLATGFF